ncbi:Complement factor B [Varanus komodoensis]|nr:Complement factor B [Varanus komodoensis]
MLRFDPLFCILVFLRAIYTEANDASCDPKTAEIIGGSYALLQNGTVLQYFCPNGTYPHPTDIRTCEYNGRWSRMTNQYGRNIAKAKCEVIHCHRPLEFENGQYEPRQPYYNVTQELRFECYQGYTLRGSQNRICLPNGKWSGETTICDDGAGQCPNPGIPIGALKTGTEYRVEYRVAYSCDRGLSLMGSKVRTCKESGTWSGSEPECRSAFSYDTPNEVAAKFISSLTEVAESSDPDKSTAVTEKRKIKIEAGGSLSIYIVLDASRSIQKDTFKKAKDAAIKLIEKVSSYDISPKYGIITFATDAKQVVSTIHEKSSDAAWVIEKLENMAQGEHKKKPGTNIYKGLLSVYTMMIDQQEDEIRRKFMPPPVANKTRHVILLLSDGDYNMGGTPVPVIGKIKDFLRIGRDRHNPREDYLDVYVFGVGKLVNMANMNDLASRKPGETHIFKLKDYNDVREAFEAMIDESQALSMCGLTKEHDSAEPQEKYPWHATIRILRPGTGFELCKGAIVSEYYILTAAHCFTIDDTAEQITVVIGKTHFDVAALDSHPQYTIGKLKHLGISEFYDYDVALLKLAKKVVFSSKARTICLPCTAGATRALRKTTGFTSCKEHEEALLPVGDIPSRFVSDCSFNDGRENGLHHLTVRIKNGEKKMACEEDAKKAEHYKNVTDVSQVVTDRFLCTGGTDPQVDPNTCKGDSGGPLIIEYRNRFIQVGVISWGVVDVCKGRRLPSCNNKDNPGALTPSYARDFHINLFKVLPWLKEKLSLENLDFI